MTENYKLDPVDVDILAEFFHKDMWKNEAYRQINNTHENRKPLSSHSEKDQYVSVQTVGRRVNQLARAGYLKSQVMRTNEESSQEFINGFSLTDKGKESLRDMRICVNCEKFTTQAEEHTCMEHNFIQYLEFHEQKKNGELQQAKKV